MRFRRSFQGVLALGGASLAWGVFESQWVRLAERELPIRELPRALDGLRIGHLSDLHLGAPGLNTRAFAHGVELMRAAAPDLICISGDLRARERGDPALRDGLRALEAPLGTYAVLGNHDHADGHDPFADGRAVVDLSDTGVQLLDDARATFEHEGASIAVCGLAPRGFSRDTAIDGRQLAALGGDLRILLCHFPEVLDRLRVGDFHLVLAGHLHGGQICVPLPSGKFRLAHLSREYLEGVYAREGTTMHVSRGLGTTLVPIRFAARPEVTVLTLRAA